MPQRPENGREPSFGASKICTRVQPLGARPVLTGYIDFAEDWS
jgi:hypothetical protein